MPNSECKQIMSQAWLSYITLVQSFNPARKAKSSQETTDKKQVLERMRRKGNTCALLVGMQKDAASVENGMEVPQKN